MTNYKNLKKQYTKLRRLFVLSIVFQIISIIMTLAELITKIVQIVNNQIRFFDIYQLYFQKYFVSYYLLFFFITISVFLVMPLVSLIQLSEPLIFDSLSTKYRRLTASKISVIFSLLFFILFYSVDVKNNFEINYDFFVNPIFFLTAILSYFILFILISSASYNSKKYLKLRKSEISVA